jgi:hypothetical protein
MAVRWQHFADILLSVEAVLGEQHVHVLCQKTDIIIIGLRFTGTLSSAYMVNTCERFSCLSSLIALDADEDKEMAGMLTDYQEIVGFLRVHKLASINTQVCSLLCF